MSSYSILSKKSRATLYGSAFTWDEIKRKRTVRRNIGIPITDRYINALFFLVDIFILGNLIWGIFILKNLFVLLTGILLLIFVCLSPRGVGGFNSIYVFKLPCIYTVIKKLEV